MSLMNMERHALGQAKMMEAEGRNTADPDNTACFYSGSGPRMAYSIVHHGLDSGYYNMLHQAVRIRGNSTLASFFVGERH
jgi:hypothetical protein